MREESLNNIDGNLTDDLVGDLTESEPTVKTDKDDYAPGETAEITGSGFTPGSEVVIQIVDDPTKPGDDRDADVYQPITVIADQFGSFSTTWFVPTDDDGTGSGTPDALNATLFLTATGTGADGAFGTGDDQVATTTFTDGGRPGSNNTGNSDRPSENVGQPDIVTEVSIILFSDIDDTITDDDTVGFFPGAVASFTKTITQGNEILGVEFEFADLDLRAELTSFGSISYTFESNGNPITEANPEESGSFFLDPSDFSPEDQTPLINDLSFISENLFNLSLQSDPDPSFPEVGNFFPGFGVNFEDEITTSSEPVDIAVDPPVATDNTAMVTEDGPSDSGNLITDDDGAGVDSDPNGGVLSVSEVDGVTDPNTDVIGTFGYLDWNADGSYTYNLNNDDSAVQSLRLGATRTDRFTYTLTDEDGGSDTADLTITINGTNDPPTAVDDDGDEFSDDFITDEDTAFTTANVLTNDTDLDAGDTLSIVSIDTSNTLGLVTDNGNGTFRYDPNGQFEFLLEKFDTDTDSFSYTISDGNGGTDTATVTILITGVDDRPTANNDTGIGFITDEDTTLTTANVLDNDTDPDNAGEPLFIDSFNTSNTRGLVTGNFDNLDPFDPLYGTFEYNPNGKFEFLAVGETATDSFSYTISDSFGSKKDTATVTITIEGVNDAPTANNDTGTGFITDEDTAFTTASVLTNDTDPDASDTLSIPSFDTSGTRGLVTDNGDGTFDYNPNGQFESLVIGETATDSFSYTISDGNGGEDTATVTITIEGTNNAPTANNDTGTGFITDEDTAFITASVITNDTDPDPNDTLRILSFDTANTQGLITDNGDGTFDYNPNGQFESLAVGETTTDSFSYTISDGNGGEDTANVTITIEGVNDAPTANIDQDTGFITDEDTAFTTASVLTNDTEPDTNDILSILNFDTSNTQGSVTDNGDGTFDYNPNGQFESLAVGETTTDSFSYTISDGNGGEDTANVTITINGVNDAPTLTLETVVAAIDENGNAVLTGTVTDEDGSGNSTLEIDWGDGNDETINLDASSSSFSIPHQYLDDNPSDTASDTYTISVTVTDEDLGEDTNSETVTVNNVAPIITSVDVESVFFDDDDDDDDDDADNGEDEGVQFHIQGTFTDPGSRDILTGQALWSDGVSTSVTVEFDGVNGTGTFNTTRSFSEDELEDKFPEVDDDNFPGIDLDDAVLVGVNLKIMDDDNGIGKEPLEFLAGEEGEAFIL